MKMEYFKYNHYIEGIKLSSCLSESYIRNGTQLYVCHNANPHSQVKSHPLIMRKKLRAYGMKI